MPKFDTIVTIEDEDGDEHEIDVEIEYTDSAPDPDVGYNGGLEEFSFTQSDHKFYSVAILNKRLDDNEAFLEHVRNLIEEEIAANDDGDWPDTGY